MVVSLIHYPLDLLFEERLSWEISGSVLSGGQTAGGVFQLARLDGGGFWKALMSDIGFWTDDTRKTWRALAAHCDGGVQPIVVPVRETIDAPWPTVAGELLTSLPEVAHSDGALFSDGSGYLSNVINATADVDAALRATEMTIAFAVGGALRGGEYFSIEHSYMSHRLYRINRVTDNGDDTFTVKFRPPLRAAVTAGEWIEFDRPKCVMRLATPDAMDTALEAPFFAKPSIAFVEAFPPFPE